MFKLYANKNNLSLREREIITSGSKNVYDVHFSFSADWDKLAKTAIFQYGGRKVSVSLKEDGECKVPWEVLSSYGRPLMVGVYGQRDDTVVLPTVWVSLGVVLQGALSGEKTGPDPVPEDGQKVLEGKGDNLFLSGQTLNLRSGEKVLSSVDLPGSGADITLGDGLSKEGDTLSVDNPVRGIMTKTEYDALTEEQKAKGTYFVDDGLNGGGGEVYSTEEQVIGRWIDGKPLYRKVYTGSATFSTTSTITVIEKDFRSTKSVKRMSGIIESNYNTIPGFTYTYAMPTSACTTELDRYINLFISGSGDLSMDIVWDTSSIVPAPFELIVEYTKTTDLEVSA